MQALILLDSSGSFWVPIFIIIMVILIFLSFIRRMKKEDKLNDILEDRHYDRIKDEYNKKEK